MNIYDDVINIKGVGPKTSQLLNNCGIFSVLDLILYFPRDYKKYKICTDFDDIFYKNENTNNIIVKCKVKEIKKDIYTRNGKVVSIIVFSDGKKNLKAKWFNQSYIKNKFTINSFYIISGNLKRENNEMFIINPKILNNKKDINEMEPIYPLKGKLKNSQLKRFISQVLENIHISENIPNWIVKENNYCSLDFAIRNIHNPKNNNDLIKARERLKFQELLVYSIKILMLKEFINKDGISFDISPKITGLKNKLPYNLTNSQNKVIEEILTDAKKDTCMNRLIQGDVGSGKTIVAIIAMFNVVMNGYQVVMMAPTEILAKQHYNEIKKILKEYDFNIKILSGSISNKDKDIIKKDLKNGNIHILIGTHALLEEDVHFNKLGLIVTDEQHRFGVVQRSTLINKSSQVDTLVMTATPIPRTLSLYLYGDLDISIIDELPPGRKKVNTYFRGKKSRENIYKFVRSEVIKGRQAYIVCPLIEDSDKMNLSSVESLYDELKEKYFYDFKVDMLHGNMSSESKDKVMNNFKLGKTKVLISTTVIEVGIDVPNATVMVVENAERFGLSQLHQLRGRVGRGEHKSYCILIAEIKSDISKRRMDIITRNHDGFNIAEEDLKLRGSGEIFGFRQHGETEFVLADVYEDIDIFKLANFEARKLINSSNPSDIKIKNKIFKEIEHSSNFICFN